MRVIQPPSIQFKCDSCGAVNEGQPDEFTPRNTMPPSWIASCGFCYCKQTVFPSALIAKTVGLAFLGR